MADQIGLIARGHATQSGVVQSLPLGRSAAGLHRAGAAEEGNEGREEGF